MQMQKWLEQNAGDLSGKTVVITGATGGLGSAACRYFLAAGGNILMVNRSLEKSEALCASLRQDYPGAEIQYLLADLEDMDQVRQVCDQLRQQEFHLLMLNAGTYAIPRAICSSGYDNVFQTNFVSHYFMVRQLLPQLKQNHAKVVATGSIAHKFNPTDPADVDFARHDGANNIYGNSKRYLMFALMELLRREQVEFAVGHPGISFTGITSHYPPRVLKVVKFSMRILFMHPGKAVRSIVKAAFAPVPYLHWVGPKFFNIWGDPAIQALDTCEEQERQRIFRDAEAICQKLT